MPEFLTLADVAVILEVKPASARVYHEVAQRNRRDEQVRPSDMPEPVQRFGNTPVWTREQIDEWMKRRVPRRPGGKASSDRNAA